MNARNRWIASVAAFALLLGLGGGPNAYADDRPPPARPSAPEAPAPPQAQRVTIELMVVHASNAHKDVDARLQPILQHLKFTSYTGFRLLDTYTENLAPNQEATFSIAGNREVTVQLLERSDEQAKIRVRMFNRGGKLLDTTVSIHRNRSFMLAGPRHEDGILILPMTARY